MGMSLVLFIVLPLGLVLLGLFIALLFVLARMSWRHAPRSPALGICMFIGLILFLLGAVGFAQGLWGLPRSGAVTVILLFLIPLLVAALPGVFRAPAEPRTSPPMPSGPAIAPGSTGAAGIFSAAIGDRRGPVPGWTPPMAADLAPHFPDLAILELIGRGGMGAVYRVRQTDGRMAALKILRPEAGGAGFADRFAREAEALTRLQHPNIVAIRGHGRNGPWCWLLMDLVEGADLRQVLATGTLSPAQALALVPPLCAALQYAHDQGVVHRDLKPENILLDAQGVPRLVDFGLAKLMDGTAAGGPTASGAVLGTMHYMAPEQIECAAHVDHRADIYALGVVFYELLTGRLPLGRFEPPSQRVTIDVRLDEVVLRALERDPQRRWQQAGEVQAAVEGIAATPSAGRTPGESPARSDWAGRGRWMGKAALAIVAAMIVLTMALLLTRSVVVTEVLQGLIVGLASLLVVCGLVAPRRGIRILTAVGIAAVIGAILMFSVERGGHEAKLRAEEEKARLEKLRRQPAEARAPAEDPR